MPYEDSYLYFDAEGVAALRSKKLFEGVPVHRGAAAYDAAETEIGRPLPVEDDGIFEQIVDVSRNLKKYSLTPDRLSCAEGSLKGVFRDRRGDPGRRGI